MWPLWWENSEWTLLSSQIYIQVPRLLGVGLLIPKILLEIAPNPHMNFMMNGDISDDRSIWPESVQLGEGIE